MRKIIWMVMIASAWVPAVSYSQTTATTLDSIAAMQATTLDSIAGTQATTLDSIAAMQATAIDSIAALSAGPLTWTLNQVYNGTIRGNVSSVSLSNRFVNTFAGPNGFRNSTTLFVQEARYRLQDRRDQTKRLTNTSYYAVRPGIIVDLTLSDSRFFNRTVTFSQEIQNFFNNNQLASGNLKYSTALPLNLRFNGAMAAQIARSEQTFLNDRSLEGSGRGAVSYNLGSFMTLRGRVAYKQSSRQADTGAAITSGLGAVSDSLAGSVRINLNETDLIEARYSRYARVEKSLELPRGIFVEQIFDQDLERETKTVNSNVLNLRAELSPVPGLTLRVEANHREQLNNFEVARNRFNNRVVNLLKGNLQYRIGKTSVTLELENQNSLNDFGPTSVSGNRDKRRKIRLVLNQDITKTLSANVVFGTTLLQTFYLKFFENPRDRDQFDQLVNIRIRSRPFPKITAQIYGAVNQSEFVSIHRSQSQNNRTQLSLNFRPEFTYKISKMVSLNQIYGLNIEFTDHVFDENKNFLDRNITFSNTITAQLFPTLQLELFYGLLLHDRGSYLRATPTSARFLDVEQEERRDQMEIRFRYNVNDKLAIVGSNEYSRRQDTFVGGRTNVFIDGGLSLGIEGNYKLGPSRDLKLVVRKVTRFGQFNSPEQENYWVMDSSINFAF
ncbi:MAG: hypothetical protein O7D32_11355 [bacterium]|nr:hypothetical protein [bacterium]